MERTKKWNGMEWNGMERRTTEETNNQNNSGNDVPSKTSVLCGSAQHHLP
jgi:hypothetical protein